MGSCLYTALRMADVELEALMAALSAEELSNLVDEMAADPDDKHMPASVRTAYRCEKDPTGDLNRDSLINCINEIALNTPDDEEKVKYEAGIKRGKVYIPKYSEEEHAAMEKEDAGTVKLDPDMEEALMNATLDDIMALADILNTNPKEVLEKLTSNASDMKDVCLNNLAGISEQQFCDIFNALRNNDKLVKLSACNCAMNDFAVNTLCSVLEENSSLKSISLESNSISPDAIADLFESIASPNNGLLEIRVSSQTQAAMGQRVEERIAKAICQNPRLMKAGITLEFDEVVNRVSKHMIANMDKLRTNRLKDGVAPGAGVQWTP